MARGNLDQTAVELQISVLPRERQFLKNAFLFAALVLLTVWWLARASDDFFQEAKYEGPVGHASGKIERVWTSGGRYKTYYASYSYPGGIDQPETTTSAITMATYEQLHSRDVVPIIFPEDRPELGRIDWPSENLSYWLRDKSAWVIGVILLVVWSFLIWSARIQARDKWKAFADLKLK